MNYFGQVAELDSQGRVADPPRLREAADMSGEVDVLGQYDYLEVWNHDRFVSEARSASRSPTTTRARWRSSGSEAGIGCRCLRTSRS